MTAAGKVSLILALQLLALAAYTHFTVGFWGDQDWELLASRLWLNGRKLYVDQVAVMPPLLFHLYVLPVLIAMHVPLLQDYQALTLASLCLAALSIIICLRIVAVHPGFKDGAIRLQLILLLCFLFVFRIRTPFFGDRDHLLIVLTFPYLLRWMPGVRSFTLSLPLRLGIGIMAAIGFFLKPHCLLLFVAIQLVVMFQERSLRILRSPENLAVYGFGALYAACVWIYTPEYLSLILPMAYFTYSAIQGSPGGFYALILSLALAYAVLRPGQRSPYMGDIGYFTALLPFFYLYARINNGWAYSYQPLMTLLMLINGFALWHFLCLRRSGPTAWKYRLGALLCAANFVLEGAYALDYIYAVHTHPCHGDSTCPGYYQPLLDEINKQPRARSFGTLGMDYATWTRVSKLSGADWDTRFYQFWMLPRLYIADDAFFNTHKAIFFYVADALAEDLDKKKPDIVFVEVTSTLYRIRLQRPVDWVGDFSADPAFKTAWEHYRLSGSIDNCTQLPPAEDAITAHGLKETNCRYDIYRRTD